MYASLYAMITLKQKQLHNVIAKFFTCYKLKERVEHPGNRLPATDSKDLESFYILVI